MKNFRSIKAKISKTADALRHGKREYDYAEDFAKAIENAERCNHTICPCYETCGTHIPFIECMDADLAMSGEYGKSE